MSSCQGVVVFCALPPVGEVGCCPPTVLFLVTLLLSCALAFLRRAPRSTAPLSAVSTASCSWPWGSSQLMMLSCSCESMYPPGSGGAIALP
eukprot:3314076-Pyramimonas_sp.AAC.1